MMKKKTGLRREIQHDDILDLTASLTKFQKQLHSHETNVLLFPKENICIMEIVAKIIDTQIRYSEYKQQQCPLSS